MKKRRRTTETRIKHRNYYLSSDKEMARSFQRPLTWMNRLLDALIMILESQMKAGTQVTPGTENMIDLLKAYKKRAILEGFLYYFQESDFLFAAYYRYLEAVNRRLLKAKVVSHDRRACQAQLVKARWNKERIANLLPDQMGIEFKDWYKGCYQLDKAIDRLQDAIDNETIDQNELKNMVGDIRTAFGKLPVDLSGPDEEWDSPGYITKDIWHDFNNIFERIKFLDEQVRSGDWNINNAEDRGKIKRLLREMRILKHRALRQLGEFGGRSILEWYLKLHEMDIHIDNAIDLWQDGRMLPEWDSELVETYIRMAERAKMSFLRLFPQFLGLSMAFYYKELYLMDLHLDEAKGRLDVEDLRGAIRELRHVRTHKHRIEKAIS